MVRAPRGSTARGTRAVGAIVRTSAAIVVALALAMPGGCAGDPDPFEPGVDGGANADPWAGVRCRPTTCPKIAGRCGLQEDGCGVIIDCGGCTPPETCGGGGVPNQ